jgi:hypothetical protein
MLVKKTCNTASPGYTKVVTIRGSARQLENLYARRSAVEELIQSLEDYDRFRAKRLEPLEFKTA